MEIWSEKELYLFSKGENGLQKEKATGSLHMHEGHISASQLFRLHSLDTNAQQVQIYWRDQNNPNQPINTFSSVPGPVVWLQPFHCHPPWHSLVPKSHPSWKTLMWALPGLQRMCVHRAGRAGALLRAQGWTPVLPGCRAGGCSHSWKQKQGRAVFAASPKPSLSMWFPSPQAVILCCPQSIRETTVPQLPVVLITYSLEKVDLLYEYFRSAETACEPKSDISWFSNQNSKYPSNLNLGVKANLFKGYRCWVALFDKKLGWPKCFWVMDTLRQCSE